MGRATRRRSPSQPARPSSSLPPARPVRPSLPPREGRTAGYPCEARRGNVALPDPLRQSGSPVTSGSLNESRMWEGRT